jgi:phosphate transport system substrate-binding protein
VAIIAVLCALSVSCNETKESAVAGYITVKGEEELLPMMMDEGYAFMDLYEKAKILVLDGGSNYALMSIFIDSAQIAFTTRAITTDEMDRAKKGMFDIHEYKIAKDGIAIVVNPVNPISSLTIDQVKKIFTGKFTNWSVVRGPNWPIRVCIWNETAGTFNYFQDSILGGESYSRQSRRFDYTEALVRAMSEEKGAVSMISMARLYRTWSPLIEETRLKALAIRRDAKSDPVLPEELTVHDGTYPFSRFIYLYTANEPKGLASGFITYIMANPGQRTIAANGLVPMTVPVKYNAGDSL